MTNESILAPASHVVLDTNVALALWLFEDPRCQRLATSIDSRLLVVLSSGAIRAECVSVLERRAAQGCPWLTARGGEAAVMARWDAAHQAGQVDAAARAQPPWHGHPRCSDASDQKFIELAIGARAHALITRDKALLKLRSRMLHFGVRVIAPEAMMR